LGIAQPGNTNCDLPGFKIGLYFTGLILNRKELHPRLIGYALVHGEIEEFKTSNEKSSGLKIKHKEFGIRDISDAVEWKNIHFLQATPAGLAGILKQGPLTPECRARLIFYLKHRFGSQKAAKEFSECFSDAHLSGWWPEK
jgi:hypothetical protein